jgi:hypothetical protein
MVISMEERARFDEDGFLIKQGLFTQEEVAAVRAVAEADPRRMEGHGRGGAKAEDRSPELWSIGSPRQPPAKPLDDNPNLAYDALCYSPRMITAHQELLLKPEDWPGDELTLHHRKFVMKDRHTYLPPDRDEAGEHGGNGFQWHQDYWYWGDYSKTGGDAYGGPGRPYPDLLISLVALDSCHQGNGCLQVIRGSHRHRIGFRAEQWGERHAVPAEVEALFTSGHERVYCELAPGDTIFFSPQILHQSDPNGSDAPRWVFICCFDTMHNRPNGVEDWRVPAPCWQTSDVTTLAAEHLARLQRGAGERSGS